MAPRTVARHPMTLASALRQIRSNEIDAVSLDVFDTIVQRDVPPDAVARRAAELFARALQEHLRLELPVSAILEHRRAWTDVREAPYPAREVEWSVSMWLLDFATALALGDQAAAFVEKGRAAEIEAEKALTSVRAAGRLLLDEARAAGKRVIATSDSTLDPDLLQSLLDHHGLEFDALYASSGSPVSKRRGTLYLKLPSLLGLPVGRLLHVGDNFKSDFVRSTQSGLAGVWLPRLTPVAEAAEMVRAALVPGETVSDDPVANVAATYLAPLLVALGLDRAQYVRATDADFVAYIARDGWLMRLADEAIGGLGCDYGYLRLSRKAILLAHPDPLLRNFELAGKVGKTSIGAFVGGFDLPPETERALFAAAGCTASDRLSHDLRKRWARACDDLAESLNSLREERRALIAEWVGTTVHDARTIVVAATGWAGTIQDSIAASLPGRSVHGHYVGLTRGASAPAAGRDKRGLVWDAYRGRTAPPLCQSAGVLRLWDLLLREPTATVSGMGRSSGGAPEVHFDASDVNDPRAANVAQRVKAGVELALETLAPRAAALRLIAPEHLRPALEQYSRQVFAAVSLSPPPAFAAEVLDLPISEGATRDLHTTLGAGGFSSGVSWWPGLVASLAAPSASRRSLR